MRHIRQLLPLLALAFVPALALVLPLPGRADGAVPTDASKRGRSGRARGEPHRESNARRRLLRLRRA